MSLIKCPECGKEVSDQSHICIHCGYPLSNNAKNNENICLINDSPYDLSLIIETIHKNKNDYAQKEAHKLLKEMTGLGAVDRGSLLYIIMQLDKIPPQFNSGDNWKHYKQENINIPQNNYQSNNISNMPKCPKCGCTNIQIVRKKFSLLAGFATNKTERVCVNCMHRW